MILHMRYDIDTIAMRNCLYQFFNLHPRRQTPRMDFLSRLINRETHIATFRAQRRTFLIRRSAGG